MPTTPCPACGWPVDYEDGATTVGCPTIQCRVAEFHPRSPTRRPHGGNA